MTEESQDSSSLFQERGFQRIDKAVNQSLSIVRNAMHGKRSVYPTKWPRLNKNLLGGLQGGKMYVIAGRPGVGKSAFSNQLVFDLLDVNSNKDMIVLYWSFEMPGYQQVMRSASKSVNKQLGDLLSVEARLKDEEFKDYANSVQKFNKYPVFFNNIPRTMEYIKQTNEQVFMKSPNARVVNVFDHSRLIKGQNEHTELQKLNEISKANGWNLVRWITRENNSRAKALYDRISEKSTWDVYELK